MQRTTCFCPIEASVKGVQWRLLTECLSSTLQAVLTIGNTLNGNTFRGNARGFHLDALLKVVTQALAREVDSDVYLR